MSLVYLGETAKTNAAMIQQYTKNNGRDDSKTQTPVPMPSFLKFSEVDRGRLATGGSRGKLSGVKNVSDGMIHHCDFVNALLQNRFHEHFLLQMMVMRIY
jgi:hypothetical protein